MGAAVPVMVRTMGLGGPGPPNIGLVLGVLVVMCAALGAAEKSKFCKLQPPFLRRLSKLLLKFTGISNEIVVLGFKG